MENKNQSCNPINAINLEDLKKFISTVQKSNQEENVFKPERLQNLREVNFSRKYNSGLSS